MEHRCESCGQELPHDDAGGDTRDEAPADDAFDQGVLLGSPGETEQTHLPTRSRKRGSAGKDKRMLLGLLAALLAWGAFIGIGRLTAPDSAIDEQAATAIEERAVREADDRAADAGEPEPTASPLPQASDDQAILRDRAVERAADVEGDYAAADAAPGFPVESPESERFNDFGGVGRSLRDDFIDGQSLGARVAVSVEVDKLMGEFTRRGGDTFVAYRSANGVVLIDLAQGSADEIEVGPVASTPLPGASLLRSGSQTFAIDPSTFQIAPIGIGSNPVVADSRDGATYVVDPLQRTGLNETIIVTADGATQSLEVSVEGMQLLAVDGLGLLAVPVTATGESLIATPDGFVPFGANRVVTGTANAVLEQVCSPAGGCTLELGDLVTGQRTPLPDSFIRFGDSYTVSPDGGSILRRSSGGFAELFLIEANEAVVVVAGGMQHAAWGPNSDLVAWLDDTGEPVLNVMFVTEREWLTVELRDLGAPAPVSSGLTISAVGAGDEEAQVEEAGAGS